MIPQEAKDLFTAYLKEHGHRITDERMHILEEALEMKDHFNADELYLKLVNKGVSVSRATVYNTLSLISKCNLLSSNNFDGESKRYETKYGKSSHYHIICTSCSRIIEFELPKMDKLPAKICEDNQLKMVDHTLQVYAECKDSEKCDYNRKNTDSKNLKKGKTR